MSTTETKVRHTWKYNNISGEVEDAAPDMLEALEYAAEIIKVARRYFPKSISNHDRFDLENTNAAINKAITKAKDGAA